MIKALIIGASGYTGAELLRLLANHPSATVIGATSETYSGQPASALYPHLTGAADIDFCSLAETDAADADIIFTALPHGRSLDVVAGLVGEGHRVVDLSGDFRLESGAIYEKWYRTAHTQPELLDRAVYGLPELNAALVAPAELVSNPGCYPTSALLALFPALENKLTAPQGLIINSLSGVSGAGRAANETTHYCARSDNVVAYKTGGAHQHIPEMEQYLSAAAGEAVTVTFTPHLGFWARGIYTTVYSTLNKTVSLDAVIDIYTERYAGCPFVEVLPAGVLPDLKAVRGSNFCHIGLSIDERTGHLVIFSAIDNLVKGASGQAIQNMNLMFGLPETMGLETVGLWP